MITIRETLKATIVLLVLCLVGLCHVHASEVVKNNMTVDADGYTVVRDFNEELNQVQSIKLDTEASQREAILNMEKNRRIRVSRGNFVTLNGITQKDIDEDISAQILILEMKKVNLVLEKADLLQQYQWNDQNLNKQIWKMDLEMAKLDPKYIPIRGHWNTIPKNRKK